MEPQIAALAQHPQLINIVSRIMEDVPQLFQDQALIKPPLIGREKPFHQDNAYFNLPSDTTVVGVWIALDEALRTIYPAPALLAELHVEHELPEQADDDR